MILYSLNQRIFIHVHGCACSSICSWVSEHQVIQRHFILGASQTKVLLSLPPQAVLLRQGGAAHMRSDDGGTLSR